MITRRAFPVAAAFMGLAVLAACGGNKNVDPPAELTRFEATARVQRVWSANAGGGEPTLRLGFTNAMEGSSIFTAGRKGEVAAHDAETGRRLWQTRTKLPLSAGPGAGEGVVMVGASYGDVVALDSATGDIRWQSRINSELLAQPALAEGTAALRTVDGRLALLRLTDGRQIWAAEQQVPRLSLRGTGAPAIKDGIAVAGFDNGRIMALNIADGTTAWEATVAPPSGRTELERLVDIDSAIHVVDDDVYVVTFQGRIARLARDSGQVWWARDISSYRGLAVDASAVYVSTSDGSVVKIDRRTGTEAWRQDVLARRRLSPPAVLGRWVVVADLDGYVHFLDTATGELAARTQIGGDPVSAPPIVRDEVIYFLDEGGRITALRATALESRVQPADPAGPPPEAAQ